MIHYELGNLDLLEYIIKSTFRYLNKKERDYAIENLILKHMRKLSRITDNTSKKEQFGLMKSDMDEMFKDSQERVVLDYFDFDAWVTSKLEGGSFAEAVAKKA